MVHVPAPGPSPVIHDITNLADFPGSVEELHMAHAIMGRA